MFRTAETHSRSDSHPSWNWTSTDLHRRRDSASTLLCRRKCSSHTHSSSVVSVELLRGGQQDRIRMAGEHSLIRNKHRTFCLDEKEDIWNKLVSFLSFQKASFVLSCVDREKSLSLQSSGSWQFNRNEPIVYEQHMFIKHLNVRWLTFTCSFHFHSVWRFHFLQQAMLLALILLIALPFLASGQPFFDDVLFDIQNQNRFNPYAYGPPPIFHVCIVLFSSSPTNRLKQCEETFACILHFIGRSTHSIWICQRDELQCRFARFILSEVYQRLSRHSVRSATV